jgi:hypothetical protein
MIILSCITIGLLLILIFREEGKTMDFSKLNTAIAALTTLVQGLPAAIVAEQAAQNTQSQASIDAATTAVTNANTAIAAATTPAAPAAPAA